MQIKYILLIGLIAAFMIIGPVSSVEPTPTPTSVEQNISATVPVYTITITGPANIPSWSLQRAINNELDIGPVQISTTAPSTWEMQLDVSGNHDRLYSGETGLITPMYISAVAPPVPSDGWDMLTSGSIMLDRFPAQVTPVDIPVRIRQYVSTDDVDGEYSITLTYTLSVIPPV